MRMELLRDYLSDLRFIRDTGAGVAETSYYAALGNLLNGIGGQPKPAVKCVLTVKNQGAGLPDGGFFTPDQTGLPPRCLVAPGAEAGFQLLVGDWPPLSQMSGWTYWAKRPDRRFARINIAKPH